MVFTEDGEIVSSLKSMSPKIIDGWDVKDVSQTQI